MRYLITLALGLSVAVAARAQSSEIIIRRPGERDQVIPLDSAKASAELSRMEQQFAEFSHLLNGQMMQDSLGDLANKVRAFAMDGSRMGGPARLLADLDPRGLSIRPIIGVNLDDSQARASDRYGTYVAGVTPGGPADKAGIQAGDVITKVAGKSLAADATTGRDVAPPSVRLIDVISTLSAGKPVDVEFRRGNDTKTVKVTPVEDTSNLIATGPGLRAMVDSTMARSLASGDRAFGVARAPMVVRADSLRLTQLDRLAPGFIVSSGNGGGGAFTYSFSGPAGILSGLELAPVNKDLGAYFGTTEGVLVISTGPARLGVVMTTPRGDSTPSGTMTARKVETFGLLAGDVVTAVDGRKVTSPSQLMRILLTYDKGDEIKLQIMRQKHAETVVTKLP